MTVRAHPLAAVKVLKPVVFVLLIPVLRGLIQILTDRTVPSIRSFELPLLGGLIVLAIAHRLSCRIEYDHGKLRLYQGFFFRRTAVISTEKLAAVTVIRTVPDRLFGASAVLFHTEAGSPRRADFTYTLARGDADSLIVALFGVENGETQGTTSQNWLLSAAATSSAVTGWTLAVPLIRRAGKLFGVALSRLLLTRINHTAARFDAYFPAVLNVLTMLLIAGYAVSFLSALLGTACFRLRVGRLTSVATGFFTRRKAVFRRSSVRAVMLEQTPFVRAIHRRTVRIAVGGVGRSRTERYLTVPVADLSRQNRLCGKAFLRCERGGVFLRPAQTRRTAWRFYRWPVLWLILILTVAVILGNLLTFFDRFAVFLTVPLLVLAAYYGHLCRFDFRAGGMVIGTKIMARNAYGFRTRELYCPRSAVFCFRLIQTPRDRRENTCGVRIFLRTKAGDTIRVRRLNVHTVGERLRKFFR